MQISAEWDDIKNFSTNRSASIQYVETGSAYFVVVFDGPFSLNCILIKNGNSEVVDFETNFKSDANKTLKRKSSLGEEIFSTKKPDGNSFTMISHNFCDSSTWPTPTDSAWKIAPPAGKIYKVIKAEVQFSHDIGMATLVTPNKLLLDVMAGGSPVDQKEFATIADVFDLGNGHSSTPSGLTIDGVPGMTTVFFEYYDAIVLRSDWAMEMVFKLDLGTQLGGAHCSVSAIVEPMDI